MQTNPQYKIENVLFSTDSVDKHVHIVVFIPVTFITPNTINTRQQKKTKLVSNLTNSTQFSQCIKLTHPTTEQKTHNPKDIHGLADLLS